MAEPQVDTQATPAPQATGTEGKQVETPAPATPQPDLITRVSQVKVNQQPSPSPQAPQGDDKFNINDLDQAIEKIPDSSLKEHVLGLKKSLLRGENQKYQEIANLRKQYETKLAEVTTWTPERLQQELNKPDFVQAAQVVLKEKNPTDSGLNNEQWSALSEAEKQEITQMRQKIQFLEKNSWEAIKAQQDAQLRGKYANYDPTTIDSVSNDLIQGKRQATREDIFKVVDYDNAVRRAYELGLMDKQEQNKEKINGMTYAVGNNVAQPNGIQREKGESTQDFMRRSYVQHSQKK